MLASLPRVRQPHGPQPSVGRLRLGRVGSPEANEPAPVALGAMAVVECRGFMTTDELASSMSPHETVTVFLRSRFRASLPGGELGLDQPLLSSGIVDSFGVLELIAFLEDAFHVTIAPSRFEMTELETVHRIVALVERLRQGTSCR